MLRRNADLVVKFLAGHVIDALAGVDRDIALDVACGLRAHCCMQPRDWNIIGEIAAARRSQHCGRYRDRAYPHRTNIAADDQPAVSETSTI